MDYSKLKQQIRSKDADRVKKYADGGSVFDDLKLGLPTAGGEMLARGMRALRGQTEQERAMRDTARDGAAGAGGSMMGRAMRKPQQNTPNEEIDI